MLTFTPHKCWLHVLAYTASHSVRIRPSPLGNLPFTRCITCINILNPIPHFIYFLLTSTFLSSLFISMQPHSRISIQFQSSLKPMTFPVQHLMSPPSMSTHYLTSTCFPCLYVLYHPDRYAHSPSHWFSMRFDLCKIITTSRCMFYGTRRLYFEPVLLDVKLSNALISLSP